MTWYVYTQQLPVSAFPINRERVCHISPELTRTGRVVSVKFPVSEGRAGLRCCWERSAGRPFPRVTGDAHSQEGIRKTQQARGRHGGVWRQAGRQGRRKAGPGAQRRGAGLRPERLAEADRRGWQRRTGGARTTRRRFR